MTTNSQPFFWKSFHMGVLAGLAGGFAEVLWIWAYGVMSGTDPGLVARGVSEVFGAGETIAPLALGIVIHMTLAVVLGVVLVLALWPAHAYPRRSLVGYAGMTLALVAVWAVNFLVVLPRISPAFVELVPYQVSLLPKILFGLAAAAVFGAGSMRTRVSTSIFVTPTPAIVSKA